MARVPPVVREEQAVLVLPVVPVARPDRNFLVTRHHPTALMARMVRHRHRPAHHHHRHLEHRRVHHPQHLPVHHPVLVQALALAPVPEVLDPVALALEVLVPVLVLVQAPARALAAACLADRITWVRRFAIISLPLRVVSSPALVAGEPSPR